MEKIIENEEGKKHVKLNNSSDFYTLRYDWPIDTVFSFMGSMHPRENFEYDECKYVEVATGPLSKNAETLFGAYGNSFEECEEKLWKQYNKFLACSHSFSRYDLFGQHYTNGAGFCKYCGMFKSQAFIHDKKCEYCKKEANLITTLDGREICFSCLANEPFMNQPVVKYISHDSLKNYISSLSLTIKKVAEEIIDNYKIIEYIMESEKECFIRLALRYESDGFYKILGYTAENIPKEAEDNFGSSIARYFIENSNGLRTVQSRIDSIKEQFRKGQLKNNQIKYLNEEIECFEELKRMMKDDFLQDLSFSVEELDEIIVQARKMIELIQNYVHDDKKMELWQSIADKSIELKRNAGGKRGS